MSIIPVTPEEPIAGGAAPTRHVVLDGVERGAWWRRWGRLPEPGAVVDLVAAVHPDRVNVVDDRTLELLGSIPKHDCPDIEWGRQLLTGTVLSTRTTPVPVIIITIPSAPPLG